MKKKFKAGDLVHLNPKSEWSNRGICNPLRTLGVVDDADWYLGIRLLPICVLWGDERINFYDDEDLLPAPDSLILEYLNKSLKKELKKRGIES